MSLSYDSCQSHFTSYSNFQEFIDTKNFFVNVVKLLLLVIFIKFPIFKDILKVTIVHIIQINNQPKNRKQYTFICQGLSDLERINYIINSSASFSSDKKPEIVVKQLFPEKFPENTSFTRKKLTQFGLSGAFDRDGTFVELVALMIQIKEKKLQGKGLTGLRYSEHLIHFFSLLSEKLNYIAGSILPCSETTINILEDVHPKINYILEKNAIATQVHSIALKVPIGKVPPMMIVMILTKDNYEEFSIPVHIERMIDIEDKDKEVGDNKPNESINPPNNETSSLSRSISVGYATLEIAPTADNIDENQRRRRRNQWEGRKRLETLSNNTL
ncbi:9087_t:CDS:2, partial [Funneliformis geosporum]